MLTICINVCFVPLTDIRSTNDKSRSDEGTSFFVTGGGIGCHVMGVIQCVAISAWAHYWKSSGRKGFLEGFVPELPPAVGSPSSLIIAPVAVG